MDYLARNVEKRLDPRLLVPGARTVVSLAMNYAGDEALAPGSYRLARYALGRDYHDVMRERLRALMERLGLTSPADGRAFCDTAPVAERYWAVRCGLGRVGRNGLLTLHGASAYCFLGELILTHPADVYDAPLSGIKEEEAQPDGTACLHCGRCLAACPTGALCGDGTLDARRCLSYLTIEHRGDWDEAVARRVEKVLPPYIYGCDRCAEACPRNARPLPPADEAFRPSGALRGMSRDDWHRLSPERYAELFRGSAVKRAKYAGLCRNIAAARQGSADADLPL